MALVFQRSVIFIHTRYAHWATRPYLPHLTESNEFLCSSEHSNQKRNTWLNGNTPPLPLPQKLLTPELVIRNECSRSCIAREDVQKKMSPKTTILASFRKSISDSPCTQNSVAWSKTNSSGVKWKFRRKYGQNLGIFSVFGQFCGKMLEAFRQLLQIRILIIFLRFCLMYKNVVLQFRPGYPLIFQISPRLLINVMFKHEFSDICKFSIATRGDSKNP